MATRVAGSLCLATGLGDEMIVSRYVLYTFMTSVISQVRSTEGSSWCNSEKSSLNLVHFTFCCMKEYEEKAVSSALNRPKLKNLTNRLKAVRMSCPLFDTARWVSKTNTAVLLN